MAKLGLLVFGHALVIIGGLMAGQVVCGIATLLIGVGFILAGAAKDA